MKSNDVLAARFREVILNGTWIANTNFMDQLTGTDLVTVTTKYESLNTIADLARHIHYYINGLNGFFREGTLDIRDQFSFDFAPMERQDQWDDFIVQFNEDAEDFAAMIEQLPEERMQQVFVDAKYGSYHRNIDAMIEHCYYHLGQVVLIKKLVISEHKENGSI
ncbi:DUF1572 domain-containing protein [Flavobacterium magnum]|uniref:DUF1572 domain-containing protein n=1 Tax=Flavobacterium magnum TaxID=2162713 RepID=A0A2S0RHZ4_9FLAO|nr:DUF1572 family protein [Flavobacterium magnum]AWA30880.1 DUF1572 domain-containing protein [Flavobacterium magnum]